MGGWFVTKDISLQAISELLSEKPRASAIVGAAILDTVVLETLKRYMPRATGTRDQLLTPVGGKLGDADVRAKLLYVMGVLTKAAFSDVQLVGQIRNKFAHHLEIRDFLDEPVRDLCARLSLIDTVVFPLDQIRDKTISGNRFWESDLLAKRRDPKQRFVVTIKVLTEAMIETSLDKRPSPLRELI